MHPNSALHPRVSRALIFSIPTLAMFFGGETLAQEAPNSPAATQPAAGHVTVREQFRYIRYGDDPTGANRDTDDFVFWTAVSLGLTGDLSLSYELPVTHRRTKNELTGDDDSSTGIGDMTLLLKWRFFQKDFGPIDTLRLALLGGAELPSGDDELSTDSFDPIAGIVATYIRGRHGFGGSLVYTFTTGDHAAPIGPGESLADLLEYDASYLYRAAPAEYAADTYGSLYVVAELNGLQETNGDGQIFLSPGIMYEARTWAAEFSFQLPIWQDLDERLETDFVIRFGLRFLF